MEALSLARLRSEGKPAVARALSLLERRPGAPETLALLDDSWRQAGGQVGGLTGPPGVGKSTLAGRLVALWRQQGRSVAVVAVDPSSRRSGGALLGDRIRLMTGTEDAGLFVRSMAARDRLGGLAALTWTAVVLLRAVFDVVLVETVGVGQSETDVAEAVDTVVFCVQPGGGDALQFMKAGIAEIPDVAVVTKADLGPLAERARRDLSTALSLDVRVDGWVVPVLAVSAQDRIGLGELDAAIVRHAAWLGDGGRREARRRLQALRWIEQVVREGFGRQGLERLPPLSLPDDASPFSLLAETIPRLAAG